MNNHRDCNSLKLVVKKKKKKAKIQMGTVYDSLLDGMSVSDNPLRYS